MTWSIAVEISSSSVPVRLGSLNRSFEQSASVSTDIRTMYRTAILRRIIVWMP